MTQTRVTWLGHATVLIESRSGYRLLIDPFLTNNPSYPKDFALPEHIDAILITHGHGDHMSDALPLAQKTGAKVVAIHEIALYLGSKGITNIVGMNLGGSVQLGDVKATMVEAKHSSAIEFDGELRYAGTAAGYVLTTDEGDCIYIAGDTSVFGDMSLIAELYAPQVVMLPIGGHFTMGPKEAALATRLLKPQAILPLHFGTFPPLKGRPADLQALIDPQIRVEDWKPGDSVGMRDLLA